MSLRTPEKIRTLQRKLYVKAKQEPVYRFYSLYDKVYRQDILAHAYALVRANGGAPGVDGETFADVEAKGVAKWLAERKQELQEKTYQADPVRRVWIDKPGGGRRALGIPTVRDRVVQMAAKLLLEPIFEADFEDAAYGYRPKRSALDAVEEVHRALQDRYTDVVDADLSKYFDSIPHPELMRCVARRVSDKQMLHLVKAWLKAPVEERGQDGKRRMTGGKKAMRSTPQGGVISPLLSVLYMNRFLKAWRQQQKAHAFRARIVVYADDFVILSRGKADEALAWTRGVMERLGLTLNEAKTSIRDARRERFDFLGYSFGPDWSPRTGGGYVSAKPSATSLKRVRRRIKAELAKSVVEPWEVVRLRVNRVLEGWGNYFSYGTKAQAYRAVDWYVEEQIRRFLRRRHKVPTRGTRVFPRQTIHGSLGILSLARRRAVMRPA